MSTTSFFCFGPEDSYISKSFAGLTYHVHSQSLHQLLTSGTVGEVHWASLGPIIESWVLSYKSVSGGNRIVRGVSTPPILRILLDTATPGPHFRCFLGPDHSFIAWSPNFIRWNNLPLDLEVCLQSWLTPAGWKAGPPQLVTWGSSSTFFALSTYGEIAYKFALSMSLEMKWPIFQETVEEWNAEGAFEWSDLAYISLDATTEDQFIAIRNDGTWAGSIEDTASETLEGFALNFFRLYKPRSKSKAGINTNGGTSNSNNNSNTNTQTPSPNQNGTLNNGTPHPPATTPPSQTHLRTLYDQWNKDTTSRLAAAIPIPNPPSNPRTRTPKKLQVRNQNALHPNPPPSPAPAPAPALLTSFPHLPLPLSCSLPPCLVLKSSPSSLRACPHDIETLFRAGAGEKYGVEWLRQERLRWHPDRFGRMCEEGWREEGRRLAEEMFKVVEGLSGGVREGW